MEIDINKCTVVMTFFDYDIDNPKDPVRQTIEETSGTILKKWVMTDQETIITLCAGKHEN